MNKEKKTMSQMTIEMHEEIWRSELAYWQKMHPNAKVKINKKMNEIVITYPLPKDMHLVQKFIKAL